MPAQDLESNRDSMRQAGKTAKKGYSWYSRMSKTKKIIMWLLALTAILGIALGVGLGVGLQINSGDGDGEEDE